MVPQFVSVKYMCSIILLTVRSWLIGWLSWWCYWKVQESYDCDIMPWWHLTMGPITKECTLSLGQRFVHAHPFDKSSLGACEIMPCGDSKPSLCLSAERKINRWHMLAHLTIFHHEHARCRHMELAGLALVLAFGEINGSRLFVDLTPCRSWTCKIMTHVHPA